MSNFFGRDRFKEGPGVEKDAPALTPIKQMFAIFARKFWYFVRFNFLYVLVSIPGLTLSVLISWLMLNNLTKTIDNPDILLYLYNALGVFFVIIPAVAIGPFQAGLTYILRSFAREEPVFMWSDFFDTIKKNWKQSLIVGIINAAVITIIALDLLVYTNMEMNPYLKAALFGFIMFILVIFLIMQMYIYPMLITFKLTLRQLYKNAFLFSLIKFVPNFGLLLISAALVILGFLGYSFVIGVFLYIIILPAFVGFMNMSFAYGTLKKYMIDNDSAEIKN